MRRWLLLRLLQRSRLPEDLLELFHSHPAQVGQLPHDGKLLQERLQGHLALQELLSHLLRLLFNLLAFHLQEIQQGLRIHCCRELLQLCLLLLAPLSQLLQLLVFAGEVTAPRLQRRLELEVLLSQAPVGSQGHLPLQLQLLDLLRLQRQALDLLRVLLQLLQLLHRAVPQRVHPAQRSCTLPTTGRKSNNHRFPKANCK